MTEEERFEYAILIKRKNLLEAKPQFESEDNIDWNSHLSINDVSDIDAFMCTLRMVKGFFNDR